MDRPTQAITACLVPKLVSNNDDERFKNILAAMFNQLKILYVFFSDIHSLQDDLDSPGHHQTKVCTVLHRYSNEQYRRPFVMCIPVGKVRGEPFKHDCVLSRAMIDIACIYILAHMNQHSFTQLYVQTMEDGQEYGILSPQLRQYIYCRIKSLEKLAYRSSLTQWEELDYLWTECAELLNAKDPSFDRKNTFYGALLRFIEKHCDGWLM